jgi:hypothetical protein
MTSVPVGQCELFDKGKGCEPFPGPGIYAIHAPCGRVYVGQSKGVRNRLSSHRSDLIRGRHMNRAFQLAWDAVDGVGFEFMGLEPTSISDLNARESYWMKYYSSLQPEVGFNVEPAPGSDKSERRPKLRDRGQPLRFTRETEILGFAPERGNLLFEISKCLGDFSVISVPILRRVRPDIGRLYPKIGPVELQEILRFLKSGDPFPDGESPRKISDRDLRIYQMRLEGVSFAKIGRAQNPPISKQRVAEIYKRVKEVKERANALRDSE